MRVLPNQPSPLERVRSDVFLSATRARPGDPGAYDYLWQGRSALTRLVEQRHRDLLASRDPATRELGDKLLGARQRLAQLLLAPAQEGRRHAAEIRKLTAAKEELEKELAEQLRLELPPADPTPPPPGRLAAALPPGGCFLDFYRYDDFSYDPKSKGWKRWRRTPHYVAFLLVKGKPAARVELGPAAPLERAWAAWHAAITRDTPAPEERRAAAALARLVWAPLRKALPAEVKTVYLAPDGALTQVPFAALPGQKAGTVLLEDYAFATVPHGAFLLDRLTRKGQPQPAGGVLLAVGGVDYQNAPAPTKDKPARRDLEFDTAPAKGTAPRPAKTRVSWSKLLGTGRERARVAALAEKPGGLQVRSLAGPEATTARVLAELSKAR